MILAAERKKEEGGWAREGGFNVYVCLCMSGWGISRLFVCVCVRARMCVRACVSVVSSSMCVSMMSAVSVSTNEGGVTADVLPLS